MKLYKQLAKLILPLLIFTVPLAWAMDLQSAKAQGLIGEQTNGYLGIVAPNPSGEVKALVEQTNQKRKAKYQEVANTRSISLDQVEQIAGKKAIEKTKPQQFIQVNGQWQKK